MGLTVEGFITYYSKRTYDDMKTLYAEAVGYELNKKAGRCELARYVH